MEFLKFALGALALATTLLFSLILIWFWPLNTGGDPAAAISVASQDLAWFDCRRCQAIPFELQMLVVVASAGGVGSSIHVATSFASYVGNGKFIPTWTWWYVLRIPIGVGLAILVYFLLRGGFMTVPSGGGNGARPEDYVNPFGFAGVAGLTGMFSKQATDKLQELFDTLFRTNEDAQRDDKLDDVRDEALTLRKIDPEQATVGASGQTVTLTGQFYDTDLVMVDGVPQRFDIARMAPQCRWLWTTTSSHQPARSRSPSYARIQRRRNARTGRSLSCTCNRPDYSRRLIDPSMRHKAPHIPCCRAADRQRNAARRGAAVLRDASHALSISGAMADRASTSVARI